MKYYTIRLNQLKQYLAKFIQYLLHSAGEFQESVLNRLVRTLQNQINNQKELRIMELIANLQQLQQQMSRHRLCNQIISSLEDELTLTKKQLIQRNCGYQLNRQHLFHNQQEANSSLKLMEQQIRSLRQQKQRNSQLQASYLTQIRNLTDQILQKQKSYLQELKLSDQNHKLIESQLAILKNKNQELTKINMGLQIQKNKLQINVAQLLKNKKEAQQQLNRKEHQLKVIAKRIQQRVIKIQNNSFEEDIHCDPLQVKLNQIRSNFGKIRNQIMRDIQINKAVLTSSLH